MSVCGCVEAISKKTSLQQGVWSGAGAAISWWLWSSELANQEAPANALHMQQTRIDETSPKTRLPRATLGKANSLKQLWFIMQSLLSSSCLLSNPTQLDLDNLCQAIWRWEECSGKLGQACKNVACPWRGRERLAAYFDYYRSIAANYVPSSIQHAKSQAIRDQKDLLDIIRALRKHGSIPKSALTDVLFANRLGEHPPIPVCDRNRALDFAVKVIFMINCTSASKVVGDVESGDQAIVWRDHLSLDQFLDLVFPSAQNRWEEQFRIIPAISACRLIRVGGLRLVPTNNVLDHLRVEDDTVAIFEDTAFLLEHLNASRIGSATSSIPLATSSDSFSRTRCSWSVQAWPRESSWSTSLLEEYCASIQQILFPLDPNSQSLRRSLNTKHAFRSTMSMPTFIQTATSYPYLRTKLLQLHDEVEQPKPRGYMEQWFERRSGARYVMMATFIGVIFAVLLGMLSLAVSIFQAWVSYQAWKHPRQ